MGTKIEESIVQRVEKTILQKKKKKSGLVFVENATYWNAK